jgi:excisionase family DNA binding protein
MDTPTQRHAVGALVLPTDRLLDSDEVCTILNIRRLLLYELIRRGELKSVRVGRQHRFVPSDIAAYIARGGGEETRS